MTISNKYILVEQTKKESTKGFQPVEVQDDFLYKGRVCELPDIPVFVGNHQIEVGDIVLWAKYSPDTINIEDKKFVAIEDLLKVI